MREREESQHGPGDVPETEQVPEPFRDLVDDDGDEVDDGDGGRDDQRDPEAEEPTQDEAEVDADDGI